MSTELETNLRTILREKALKIIPKNIKTGVTILGVTGTYDGGSGVDINLFIQETEPSTYNGIWIKSNTFTYDSIVENDGTTLVANSINIVKGDSHETKFFNVENDLYYRFSRIILTDENNNKINNIHIFYGNGTSWINLPLYVELRYIESTGTQYIDTNVHPNGSIKFTTKLLMKQKIGAVVIGVQYSESKAFRLFNADNKWYLDYGSGEGGNRINGGTWPNDTIYEIEVGNRYVRNLTTSTNIISGTSVGDFDYSDLNIGIFASPISTGDIAKGVLYYCKIYDNDVLVRDFIPVKDLNDVVCLYDKVSDTFFYNQGTGDFIGGPEI